MSESIHHYPVYQFTIEAYHKLVDAGILNEDDKVELIEGQIVQMSPINSSHAACVDRLNYKLRELFIKKNIIRVQNPIMLGDHSEPEPDLAIVAYRKDFYEDAHPTLEQIYLIIEVAQSTEYSDRSVKVPLYGKYNIPEVWLVNLNKKEIEVYQQPIKNGYKLKTLYGMNDKLPSTSLKKALPINQVFKA